MRQLNASSREFLRVWSFISLCNIAIVLPEKLSRTEFNVLTDVWSEMSSKFGCLPILYSMCTLGVCCIACVLLPLPFLEHLNVRL